MNGHLRGDLLVLLAAFIWGVAFYFQKTAMAHIGPLLFVGLRGAIAGLALLPFAVREQRARSQESGSIIPIAVVGGGVFLAASTLQQFGLITATVINTGFLTALYVVVTPFAFWAIERTLPSRVVWVSAALAFAGIWALGGGSIAAMQGGDMLVALAALFWGTLMVVTGRAGGLGQPMTYTCIQFIVVATLALAGALALEPISLPAIVSALDSILYVGLLSSALTFGIMAVALQHIPAPRASIMLSTEVLVSAAAGYLLLGERLTALGWGGAALILAAILLVRVRG